MKNKHINLDLRKAKTEIKAIMDKYGVGGYVSLHNQTHTEMDFFFPSWSLAQYVKLPSGKKAVQFKFDENDNSQEILAATMHLLFDCQLACQKADRQLEKIKEFLKSKIEFDHPSFEDRD